MISAPSRCSRGPVLHCGGVVSGPGPRDGSIRPGLLLGEGSAQSTFSPLVNGSRPGSTRPRRSTRAGRTTAVPHGEVPQADGRAVVDTYSRAYGTDPDAVHGEPTCADGEVKSWSLTWTEFVADTQWALAASGDLAPAGASTCRRVERRRRKLPGERQPGQLRCRRGERERPEAGCLDRSEERHLGVQ